MNARSGKLILPLALAVALLATSCAKSPIPSGTMRRIYADMFIADACVGVEPEWHMKADTLAVYPAIIAKYGYTEEQFDEAQRYYLAHPKKFQKLIEKQRAEWDALYQVAKRKVDVRDSIAKAEMDSLKAVQDSIDRFMDSISFACLFDTLFVEYAHDSISVTIAKDDSTRFVNPFVRDTALDVVPPADTLAVGKRHLFRFSRKNRQSVDTVAAEVPAE